MTRGKNAQLAVDLFEELRSTHGWSAQDAWKGIAMLLLTCQLWKQGWGSFHGVVVYRESNDFRIRNGKENATIRKARSLTRMLSEAFGVEDACSVIGQYWRRPEVSGAQPNNLVGHAFRSLVGHVLGTYGNPDVKYEEEVDPHDEFTGLTLHTRSKSTKIDIVARKGRETVALISTRWRFRHDRVDLVDEALAYAPSRRFFPNIRFYGVVGEFASARNEKVLKHCPPLAENPPIAALVHFHPELITRGLGENGRMEHLKSLEWLIESTLSW